MGVRGPSCPQASVSLLSLIVQAALVSGVLCLNTTFLLVLILSVDLNLDN